MRRGAFTLIEIMAVLALMGLLATATAWSLAEDARRSTRAGVVGQIIHADRMTRIAAQSLGKPCVLRFDLDEQRVWRTAAADGQGSAAAHALRIPDGYRIDRIMTSSSPASPGDAGSAAAAGVCDGGIVDIAYSTGGRSASYALRLVSDGADGAKSWLVFSGLTGQAVQDQNEDQVDNLFAMLATGRPDAH
jgi:prepilin-type N-terminal cleavage/methylation domain-containing protein